MGPYKDIVMLLLGPPVAFALGYFWQRAMRLVVHRRARSFWKPLLEGELVVVVGQHRTLSPYERSGLVGLGSVRALTELTRYFSDLGFKNYRVFYNDLLSWRDDEESPLKHNLLLIGGPDANAVTREVIARINTGIRVAYLEHKDSHPRVLTQDEAANRRSREGFVPCPEWLTPVFVDDKSGHLYVPAGASDAPTSDYGMLVRTRNPFQSHKEVVVLAGGYGHGTLAATRYALSESFLKAIHKQKTLELLVRAEVVQDDPQDARIQVLRAMPD